jgi:hypothetical protein
VGIERGPLNLMSTIEELLGRKSSGSGLEIREYSRWDPWRWPRDTLYPQKLALSDKRRLLGRCSSLAGLVLVASQEVSILTLCDVTIPVLLQLLWCPYPGV